MFPLKKLLILGAGESGVGAALLASRKGCDVFVSDGGEIKEDFRKELDAAGVAYEGGGHSEKAFSGVDLVVKSPGISGTAAAVLRLREAGVPVISEIEFAARYVGASKIIAITGSNGKSTTTKLVYHLLQTAGMSVSLTGNIGYSLARQIAEAPTDWYALEISSFQLDDIVDFQPDVAVVLNITPDHLDRYEYSLEKYAAAKMRITENQGAEDYLILSADDSRLENAFVVKGTAAQVARFSVEKSCGENGVVACKNGDHLVVKISGKSLSFPVQKLAVKGRHNEANALAAATAALLAGVSPEAIATGLQTFSGLPHRLEPVGSINGVQFINDSKATNVDSVWYALDSMTTPIILILGGQDKGNDYGQIQALVSGKVKAIVCMGVDNAPIHAAFDALGIPVVDTASAEKAVAAALGLATAGDTVLLSPACASFDLFKNYEDRGQKFREAVQKYSLSLSSQPA